MANHKSALKRIRSSETKKLRNKYQHKSTKSFVKKLEMEEKKAAAKKYKSLRNRYQHKSARTAIQKLRETSDKKEASSLLVFVSSMIDKLVKNNIVHKNKAAHMKSNLVKKVNSLK